MFENMSTATLQEEIDNRQKKKMAMSKPNQISDPDLKPLRNICRGYINDLSKNGYVNEDHSHYIFEVAMTTVYGKNVWGFINTAMN